MCIRIYLSFEMQKWATVTDAINGNSIDGGRGSWLTCSVSPDGSVVQRGSFISSHARMVESSLYSTPVKWFFLVSSVCTPKKSVKSGFIWPVKRVTDTTYSTTITLQCLSQ